MFIVGAVNVFPSDVEYVVRAEKGLTGKYLSACTTRTAPPATRCPWAGPGLRAGLRRRGVARA